MTHRLILLALALLGLAALWLALWLGLMQLDAWRALVAWCVSVPWAYWMLCALGMGVVAWWVIRD